MTPNVLKENIEDNRKHFARANFSDFFLALLVLASLLLGNHAYAATEKILWSFGAGADGVGPNGGLLIDASGNLYGTTQLGGNNDIGRPFGTVFKLTPTGQESVLWNFGLGNDGILPLASVVMDKSGNLYSTTSRGGLYDNSNNDFGGTAFELTAAGQETVLWNFGNGPDGQYLGTGLLIDADGNLFGTTQGGGANGANFGGFGTAFELTPAGQETILWNFGNGADGIAPYSNLISDSNGNLYGATGAGGIYDSSPDHSKGGTIFKLTPAPTAAAGKVVGYTESILWNFGNGSDGQLPNNVIIDADGNLFGTTQSGGLYGGGTVFELTAGGQESILWNFGNGTDGQYPLGVIMDAAGDLYGTTSLGGTNSSCSRIVQSCGTAFKLSPPAAPGGAWTESILWNFGNGTDGFSPSSGLVMDEAGNLYGTTASGGTNFGGTLYELSNVNPSGQIALSSQHIQFPKTAIGGSASYQLAIRNTGSGQLSGSIAAPPVPFGLQGSGNFSLKPHSQTTVTLTFKPTLATRVHQLATVTSNSAKQGTIQLDLRGIGTAPPPKLALNQASAGR